MHSTQNKQNDLFLMFPFIESMHQKIIQMNNLPRMRLKYQEVRRQMERKAICGKEEKVKMEEKRVWRVLFSTLLVMESWWQ